MATIISLIGEQNLPNLLPILHLKPERVVLVWTDFTKETAVRLTRLIQDKTEVIPLVVDAYDIDKSRQRILDIARSFPATDIMVNFTGGTKMMSLAAYQAAIELNAPIFYVQSQGKKTLLYTYKPEDSRYSQPQAEEIPSLINIADYLKAHLDEYQVAGVINSGERGRQFEEAVHQALAPSVDEICVGVKMLNTVDIDFVVRCGNLVGIVETKTGLNKPKAGIDQLNTAGGRAYLGIYTQKFLVCDQLWEDNLQDLRQIATERRIEIIELASFGQTDNLSEEDIRRLQSKITLALGCSGPTAVAKSIR